MNVSVKYSGPFGEVTGYAEANRNAITALHVAGVEVTTQRINYSSKEVEYGESYRIAEKLENRPIKYDIKILHTPPDGYLQHLEPGKYHIGHLFWETDGLSKEWVWNCNLMDEIWTGGEVHKKTFEKAGVKVPIHIFPQAINTNVEKQKSFSVDKHKGFLFYSIFEWIERKNPHALLQAYWDEFKGEENVTLLLKVYKINSQNPEIEIRRDIAKWKPREYPRTILCSEFLSSADMWRLHQTGDCFVSAHRGEGWCCLPETTVLYENGSKNIEDCDGESVLTHTGEYRKAKLLKRDYHGIMVDIKPWGLPEVSFTPNHRIYVLRNGTKSWISAKDMKIGDFVILPKRQSPHRTRPIVIDVSKYKKVEIGNVHDISNSLIVNKGIAFLMGLYVADGNSHNKRNITFSINKTTKQYLVKKIKDISEEEFGITPSLEIMERNRQNVVINSSVLGRLFADLLGTKASNKKIWKGIFSCGKDIQKEFIKGAWAGDGSIFQNSTENYKRASYSTISRNLGYSMLLLVNSLVRNPLSLTIKKRRENNEYAIRAANYLSYNDLADILSIPKRKASLRPYLVKSFSDEKNSYFKIKSLSQSSYKGVVYNLSVEEDESYVTSFSVHNCVPAAEAAVVGNPIISTNLGGIHEWLDNGRTALLTKWKPTNVFNMEFAPWYEKNQTWAEVDQGDLRGKMRWVYENRLKAKQIGLAAQDMAKKKLSYEAVGKSMQQRLEEIEKEING